MAEALNLTYRGEKITYDAYVLSSLNKTVPPTFEKLRDAISQNFLKVCHLVLSSAYANSTSVILTLQVTIYFGTVEVSKVVEGPQDTPSTLINDLGGALSLWLGVSLIGLFEWFELVLRLIYSLCST